jgi:hypothetical protein
MLPKFTREVRSFSHALVVLAMLAAASFSNA